MTQKKSPTGSNRKGYKKSIADKEDNTLFPLALQGFCAPCVYFRVVKLESGRVRKLCSFTGERLTLAGDPLCEFRRTLMPCDAAPTYCVAFKCADVTAAPMVREGGRDA